METEFQTQKQINKNKTTMLHLHHNITFMRTNYAIYKHFMKQLKKKKFEPIGTYKPKQLSEFKKKKIFKFSKISNFTYSEIWTSKKTRNFNNKKKILERNKKKPIISTKIVR